MLVLLIRKMLMRVLEMVVLMGIPTTKWCLIQLIGQVFVRPHLKGQEIWSPSLAEEILDGEEILVARESHEER